MCKLQPGVDMPIVRISRGSFKPDDYDKIAKRLSEAHPTLVPGIRQLDGCLHYWAGIDHHSNTMVNVSVWRSLTDAKQMETLSSMLALAAEFSKLGVNFERPIINYDILWEV
jgi:quinol monooxygenase YgiN